jgi:hypothetical protein
MNQCDEIAVLVFGGSEAADETSRGQTPNPVTYQDPHVTAIRLLQPFTTDHGLVAMRLADRNALGPAPLYDTMQQGLKMLESAHFQDRAMIVITDGVDDSSSVRKEDLIATIIQSRAPVYAIELGEPNARGYIPKGFVIGVPIPIKTGKLIRVDAKTLDELATPNGGHLFVVPKPMRDAGATLMEALSATAADLHHGYAIGVVAPAGLGRPKVSVVVNNPKMIVSAHPAHGL